ncbi:MAG: serine acetyltransferase [Sedimentisphaerales bacterium]|nr:serine acetyltransferase [Sedimentisphaerales bacterium]
MNKECQMTTGLIDQNLAKLTRSVINSYSKHKDTQRLGETFLPSRAGICEIIDLVQQLLFPGYYGHKQLTKENIQFHVGNLIVRIGRALTEQICACWCVSCHQCDMVACHRRAEKIAHVFLERIPAIRQALALDAQAFYDGDPAAKSLEEIIYCYPGFYAITIHRMAHELFKLEVPLMPRIMSERAHSLTGTDIHPGAEIGKSFFIDHATGVVIGETTKIGNNVRIYQGVTLGAKSFPKDERGRVIKGLKRHPTIEDNVTIYPNATILGGDTVIGRGVTVGGNLYITESISANSLVKQETPKMQVLPKTKRKTNK